MVLRIYADPCTVNCHKVLACLDLVKQPFELVRVDYFKSEQKSPDNTKLNPFQTIPFAVLDDGSVVTESNAILQYAADQQGADSVYPKDPSKRANINRWLLWETSSWFPSCYVYLVENGVKPLLGAQPDPNNLAAEEPRWKRYAQILDEQLSKTHFLTGETITLADIAVASPIHLPDVQKFPIDHYPNLKDWLHVRMNRNSSWLKTQRDVDKALNPGKFVRLHLFVQAAISNTSQGTLKATIHYTKDLEQPPEIYFYEDEKADKVHFPGDDAKEVTMTDGWPMVESFTLDKDGFSVDRFKTDFEDWENHTQVAEAFYPEIVDFLKRTVGAKRVEVFDHTIRSEANAQKKLTEEKDTSQRSPVMLVHCEYVFYLIYSSKSD